MCSPLVGLGRAREKTSYQALICRPRAIFNGRACSQANRCEELGEILSEEILTNKQGECRLIQSSRILSIYLFRRHDIIYSFSFSYHFFSCNAEVHGRAAISKDKKTYQS